MPRQKPLSRRFSRRLHPTQLHAVDPFSRFSGASMVPTGCTSAPSKPSRTSRPTRPPSPPFEELPCLTLLTQLFTRQVFLRSVPIYSRVVEPAVSILLRIVSLF